MAFKVGQKVVCIRGENCVPDDSAIKGEIYTVRESGPSPFPGDGGSCYVCFHEIHAGYNKWGEVGYHAENFRPLQETGMSILKAILANPHKQLETVE